MTGAGEGDKYDSGSAFMSLDRVWFHTGFLCPGDVISTLFLLPTRASMTTLAWLVTESPKSSDGCWRWAFCSIERSH